MILIAYIPLLIALLGLLMFALSASAKVVEVGKCFMWCGTLVTLFTVASKSVHLP